MKTDCFCSHNVVETEWRKRETFSTSFSATVSDTIGNFPSIYIHSSYIYFTGYLFYFL